MAVFVSLCVDDLEARTDPDKSDRVATYDMPPEVVAAVLALIKKYKPETASPRGVKSPGHQFTP